MWQKYDHYLYRPDRNQPTAWPFQHDNIAHFEQHMSKLYLHYKSILFWLFLNIQIFSSSNRMLLYLAEVVKRRDQMLLMELLEKNLIRILNARNELHCQMNLLR